jgi:hypothetical protein
MRTNPGSPAEQAALDDLAGFGRAILADKNGRNEASWHPRAADVPDYRDELLRAWAPDGVWTRIAPVLAQASGGTQDLIPGWELASLEDSALWYVGGDMCDLLVAAATDLPARPLTRERIPDLAGLVIFERLLIGIDAEALNVGDLHVAGYLWGPAVWAHNGDPCIGITVYGSMPGRRLLNPHGGLIWPLGRSADDPLTDEVYAKASDSRQFEGQRLASIAEDRRRLLALWLLSSQPGLTSSTMGVPGDRAATRRAQRNGRDARVRVVQLRHRPASVEGESARQPGRTFRHRWTVAGYWRRPPRSPLDADKSVYVNPFVKGPEGAPLLTSPKVKAWTR